MSCSVRDRLVARSRTCDFLTLKALRQRVNTCATAEQTYCLVNEITTVLERHCTLQEKAMRAPARKPSTLTTDRNPGSKAQQVTEELT